MVCQDSLFSVQWTPLSITGADDAGVNVGGGSVVVLGGGVGVVEGLVGVGVSVSQYPGLAEFESVLGDGVALPDVVVLDVREYALAVGCW